MKDFACCYAKSRSSNKHKEVPCAPTMVQTPLAMPKASVGNPLGKNRNWDVEANVKVACRLAALPLRRQWPAIHKLQWHLRNQNIYPSISKYRFDLDPTRAFLHYALDLGLCNLAITFSHLSRLANAADL